VSGPRLRRFFVAEAGG
jgi:hypothetical protein